MKVLPTVNRMESILKIFLFLSIASFVENFPLEKVSTSIDLTKFKTGSYPDERAGKSLKAWENSTKLGNPEEQGTYFEGDIMFSEARKDVDLDSDKWKDGVVPYEVRGSFCKIFTL